MANPGYTWPPVPPPAITTRTKDHQLTGMGERGNGGTRKFAKQPTFHRFACPCGRLNAFPRSRDPALRPEPAKPAWGLPQYCEMFSTIPIPIIAKSSDDPPKLTNGSG